MTGDQSEESAAAARIRRSECWSGGGLPRPRSQGDTQELIFFVYEGYNDLGSKSRCRIGTVSGYSVWRQQSEGIGKLWSDRAFKGSVWHIASVAASLCRPLSLSLTLTVVSTGCMQPLRQLDSPVRTAFHLHAFLRHRLVLSMSLHHRLCMISRLRSSAQCCRAGTGQSARDASGF